MDDPAADPVLLDTPAICGVIGVTCTAIAACAWLWRALSVFRVLRA